MSGPDVLPDDLPRPVDDGAVDHLKRSAVPDIALGATDGTQVSLARRSGRVVVYVYPRTGEPGREPAPEWNAIPGARGCTPQSCSFRDHFAELRSIGVSEVFGLSTQDTAYQREAVERLHLPFPLLSDERLEFARTLNLPTFEFGGMTLIRRMAFVIDDGRITKVFYPVFPPDCSASDVVDWLGSGAGA